MLAFVSGALGPQRAVAHWRTRTTSGGSSAGSGRRPAYICSRRKSSFSSPPKVNVIGKGDPPQVRSYHVNGARVRYDNPSPPMLELLQDGEPVPGQRSTSTTSL